MTQLIKKIGKTNSEWKKHRVAFKNTHYTHDLVNIEVIDGMEPFSFMAPIFLFLHSQLIDIQ